jgi:hypothetical protein
VGEGITGSPVIGPAECSGVGRVAVGAIPDAGLGYLLKPDGKSCLGQGADGKDRVVDTVPPAGVVQDSPAFPPSATRPSATSGAACRSSRRRPACGGRSTRP